MQRDCILAGDRDCIFLWGNGLCVQQPWQNISPWSVADRFLSTFSFILICSSSLSRTHAENEVSRLRTAPQPTCRVSLFSLPIHFMLGSRLFQTQRKCMSSTTVFSILPSPAPLLKEKKQAKKAICWNKRFFVLLFVPDFFLFGYVNIHVEGIVITSGPM